MLTDDGLMRMICGFKRHGTSFENLEHFLRKAETLHVMFCRFNLIYLGPVAQLARASVFHSEGRRFNSCRVH